MLKTNKIEVLENGTLQLVPYHKCFDYYVTIDGDVYSKKSGGFKKLKPSNATRYPSVRLCYNGKTYTTNIHRMVAETFIHNPDGLEVVNHKDGDKTNNHISNLEWCTMQHNLQHAYDTGLNKGKPKLLSEDDVREVLDLYHNHNMSMRKIAKKFNTNHCLISREIKLNKKDK